jgi:hypothetical protein
VTAVRHHDEPGNKHRTSHAAGQAGPVLNWRERHYLVWGLPRLALGMLQMTFAGAAILNLIFIGLTAATLSYAAVASIATLMSRILFHGHRGPRR